MTFKEFITWCNQRACDGVWTFLESFYFRSVIYAIGRYCRKDREREWQFMYHSEAKEYIDAVEARMKGEVL